MYNTILHLQKNLLFLIYNFWIVDYTWSTTTMFTTKSNLIILQYVSVHWTINTMFHVDIDDRRIKTKIHLNKRNNTKYFHFIYTLWELNKLFIFLFDFRIRKINTIIGLWVTGICVVLAGKGQRKYFFYWLREAANKIKVLL